MAPASAHGLRGRIAEALPRLRSSHGFRSGAVLGIAGIVFSLGGYLFNTICIRFLGPARYGDLAALVALAAVVGLPLQSLQSLVAREVAGLRAADDLPLARAMFRRYSLLALATGAVLTAIGLMLAGPISSALSISSEAATAAGVSVLLFTVVAAVLFGFLQGTERFKGLGVAYAMSGVLRPLLVVPVLLAGLGVAGALGVNLLASFGAVALGFVMLRDFWYGPRAGRRPRFDGQEAGIMILGMLAFASLTNIDVVLASFFLSDHDAGIYAAAALVGKFVLFLPSAVVMVLLPKVSHRVARGGSASRVLLLSATVTTAITLALAIILALVPVSLLTLAFGSDFAEAQPLLWPFGVAMTFAALVNVYLYSYVAHRHLAFPLLVFAAGVAQIALVAAWHPDPRSIVIVTLFCCLAVVLVHEAFFPYSFRRLVREVRVS